MKEITEDKVMAIIGGHSRCYLGEMDTQSRLVEDKHLIDYWGQQNSDPSEFFIEFKKAMEQ